MGKEDEATITKVDRRAEDIVKELTQETAGPVYKLRDKKILGEFDLRHRAVDVAVDIRDCEFQDEVNLGYCEFKQAVDLSGCTFHEKFNSGEKAEAHAIYRKDLICDGVTFKGDACFAGARIEGDTYFRAIVRGEKRRAVLFRGRVDFSGLKCSGYGFFEGARFESEEEADFSYASFGEQLDCDDAVFKGSVSFEGARCEGAGLFENVRFESGDQSFRTASFKGDLNCKNATFEGRESDFRYLTVGGSLIFRNAYFDTRVSLGHADISKKLVLGGSRFKEQVRLYDAKINLLEIINDNTSFVKAAFTPEQLEFLKPLKANAALWTNFTRIHRHYRDRTRPEEVFDKADIQRLSHKGNLLEAALENKENLESIEFIFDKQDIREKTEKEQTDQLRALLRAAGATVKDEKRRKRRTRYLRKKLQKKGESKKGATGHMFRGLHSAVGLCRPHTRQKSPSECLLEGFFPFENESLNLSNVTFERFHGGLDKHLEKELALKLAREQEPITFSRDPYVQLENFYKSEGNDAEARNVYYEGRLAYRDAARAGNGGTEWTLGINVLDWLWKWVTRYGISLKRLFAIALFFVILGTFLFSPNTTLVEAKTSTVDETSTADDSYLKSLFSPPKGTNRSLHDTLGCWSYRATYSLDQFLPLVNLRVDEKWTPKNQWYHAYAVTHAMMGWLIVPLLGAALAGIIRK